MSKAPRFRLYMAISLDGFIASPDGTFKWLEPYDPYSVGLGEFLAEIGSIVMGRKSFEQMLSFGAWPYEGKRTVVMTRTSFRATTPLTDVSSEPVGIVADRLARETTNGDVWIFGGGEIARAFFNQGLCDTLELCVVPVVIGDGIPLFGPGTRGSQLRLKRAKHYDSGLVCLDYDVLAAD
jgi:dihydrofolate reductase